MGVRGLSSFFDLNPDLSLQHYLHDTEIVIDGNNLVHLLYFNSRLECVYGGDYDRYADVVRDFFSVLFKCNIKPFIIFDGGYDLLDKKLRTVQERTRQKLSIALQIAKHGQASEKMLPILAHGVLRDILVELNIPHVQCDFEADNQIVAIANHLQCPVLSQDSDFYIYDIVNGFVRLDSVDLNCIQSVKPDGRTYYYLKCKIYYVSNFLSNFPGIDRAVLPLFGTLIGNDIVNIQTFETFFLNMKLPKMKSKTLKVHKRHIRMVGLLTWLQYRNLSEAVEFVLGCLKKSHRDAARELIYESVNAYKKCNTNLIHYLSDKIWEVDTPKIESNLVTYEGYALPEWFIRHFHKAFLSPFFANVLGLHRVFLQVQVEDANEPNTYLCSLSLRKVLYGIMFSFQSLLVGDHESQKQDKLTRLKYVEEHGRNGKNIQKSYIEPNFYIEGFGSVPTFIDLPKLDITQKRHLLVSALGVNYDKLNSFPGSLQLFVGIVWFWIRNASPLISENFLNVFIVALIVLDVIKPYCSGQSNSKSSILLDKCVSLQDHPSLINIQKFNQDYGLTELFLKPEDVKTVEAKTRKYFRKPQHSNAHKFDVLVVHYLNQFQTCLLFSLYLNKLLLEPFISPQAERFINGTFMYNLTRELQSRSAPELFITELLGRNSSVLSVFHTLRYRISEGISSDFVAKVNLKQRGCQSLKKKKTRHRQAQIMSRSGDASDVNVEIPNHCSHFEISVQDSTDVFI